MQSKESAQLVEKNFAPNPWIMWSYVEIYQHEGTEFKGGH